MLRTTTKPRILLVDDDVKLLGEVKSYLERQDYAVVTAVDGHTALKYTRESDFDLVILDINLRNASARDIHSIDGIELLRILRDSGEVPVLMLSATNIASVKVMALSLGADDYVSKPFDLQELEARIKAILRRVSGDQLSNRILTFQRLRIDPGERRVWKDDVIVDLTSIEFDILQTLAQHPEHVFTRNKLIDVAWKGSYQCVPKAVDVHIGHIRKKLEDDPGQPELIVTVRGTGYRFEGVPV